MDRIVNRLMMLTIVVLMVALALSRWEVYRLQSENKALVAASEELHRRVHEVQGLAQQREDFIRLNVAKELAEGEGHAAFDTKVWRLAELLHPETAKEYRRIGATSWQALQRAERDNIAEQLPISHK